MQETKSTTTYPDICVLIASTLVPDPNKPLSYTSTRSVYTPEQRLDQTIKSIASVKKYLPGSTIIISDNSAVLPDEFKTKLLKEGVDIVHVHAAEANSVYKANGEAQCTLAALEKLRLKKECKFVLKLSGRYWLNQNFKADYFLLDNRDKFVFWRDADNTVVSTVLYGIPQTKFDTWESALKKIVSDTSGLGYEVQIHRNLHSYSRFIPSLGVEGHVSVNGEFFSL